MSLKDGRKRGAPEGDAEVAWKLQRQFDDEDQLAAVRAARGRQWEQQKGQLAAVRAAQETQWRHSQRNAPPELEYLDWGVVVAREFFSGGELERIAATIARASRPDEIRERRNGTIWIHVKKKRQYDAREAWSTFVSKFDEDRWRRCMGIQSRDSFPRDLLNRDCQVTANVFFQGSQGLGFHRDKIGRRTNGRQGGYRSAWLVNVNIGASGELEYFGPDEIHHHVFLNHGDAVLFDGNNLTHRILLRDIPSPVDLPPWHGRRRPVRLSLQLRAATFTQGPRGLLRGRS